MKLYASSVSALNCLVFSTVKPAPVKIVEHASNLTANDSVVLKLKWKPDDHVKNDDLKYLISVKKAGDDAVLVSLVFFPLYFMIIMFAGVSPAHI